jgi:hypothetical protein
MIKNFASLALLLLNLSIIVVPLVWNLKTKKILRKEKLDKRGEVIEGSLTKTILSPAGKVFILLIILAACAGWKVILQQDEQETNLNLHISNISRQNTTLNYKADTLTTLMFALTKNGVKINWDSMKMSFPNTYNITEAPLVEMRGKFYNNQIKIGSVNRRYK